MGYSKYSLYGWHGVTSGLYPTNKRQGKLYSEHGLGFLIGMKSVVDVVEHDARIFRLDVLSLYA